ncbi:Major Facilitator Superfamily protein [Paenibacillus sp. GP183]|nr:Major Facilitator Superfamily protein [Paenibacillus sp. GP183]
MILGLSSGVLLEAAFSAAAKMVPLEKIGSAIGTIILGFSSALILGVPIGIALTHMFGWQMIFLFLAAGSLIILIDMALMLPEIEGDTPVPFSRQFIVLANPVILSALLLVLFREAGNSVMFTYLTSFLDIALLFLMGYVHVHYGSVYSDLLHREGSTLSQSHHQPEHFSHSGGSSGWRWLGRHDSYIERDCLVQSMGRERSTFSSFHCSNCIFPDEQKDADRYSVNENTIISRGTFSSVYRSESSFSSKFQKAASSRNLHARACDNAKQNGR